jgi:1-acyl-sn-glycerol-3-phosphate acyltransferase
VGIFTAVSDQANRITLWIKDTGELISSLLTQIRAGVLLLLLAATLVLWAIPAHIPVVLKSLISLPAWQRFWSRVNEWVFEGWIGIIVLEIRLTLRIKWDIQGIEGLRRDRWYFVNSNHQAWTDIPVLFTVFYRRIPALKFFLKKELIWVPIIGTACWAFEFPFMKRYSVAYLKKHPEKRGKDLEATRKACEQYKQKPAAIINFIEGTRFTAEKHRRQNSPYRHLLRPKAGGMAFALHAMDGKIKDLINVTIVYPDRRQRLWDFLGGRISSIIVRVRQSRIPEEFLYGNYLKDTDFKIRFQTWLNKQWQTKDEQMEQIIQQ